MTNSISNLELNALNEIISIANEFTSEEYRNKVALDENLKSKYEKTKPMIKYINIPQINGHYKSSIELRYVKPEEEVTIWFSDGKPYWSSTPKDFTERMKNKLSQEWQ
jgi:hypothetical protein